MARTDRSRKPRFMLSLQGRSQPRVAGNDPQLTVNLLTGSDDHFVYAGTFTVSEREYDELVRVLRDGLKDRLEIAFGPIADRRPDTRRKQRPRKAA